MSSNGKGKNNSEGNLSLKEAASNLGISEATVKKYIKEFDLSLEKQAFGRTFISQETLQALSEIAKLRANGLSISEIKELKSQQPTSTLIDEIENPDIAKAEKVPEVEAGKPEQSEDIKESISSNGDISGEETENNLDEEKDLDSDSAIGEEVSESEDDEAKDGSPIEGEPRRRRGFNYRYVERQISNDSKRISSLRRRLQNPNISIQEKLFFEEALERRILFLNGWKHILRWVSKR